MDPQIHKIIHFTQFSGKGVELGRISITLKWFQLSEEKNNQQILCVKTQRISLMNVAINECKVRGDILLSCLDDFL